MDAMTDPIERGLEAWMSGDLDALAAVLDPAVNLRAVEPGPWDCDGREEVMRLLRLRQGAGTPPYSVHIDRLDRDTYIVRSERPIDPDGPEPFPVATRVSVSRGRVVALHQFRADEAGLTNETARGGSGPAIAAPDR